MEIQNEVTERIGAFTGQKSAFPHALSSPGEAEKIENFVSRRGRLRKIWGTTLYADPVLGGASGAAKWIDHFKGKWVFQQGNVIGIEGSEGSQTFFLLGGIRLGADNVVRSDRWVDVLFLSNGVENKYIENNVFGSQNILTLGLVPPGNGRKWVALQGEIAVSQVSYLGNTPAAAEYAYVITFWDNNRRVESMPWGSYVNEDGLWVSSSQLFAESNAVVATATANTAMRVDISAIKALGYDTERVTHFLIYRRKLADNTLCLIADPTDTSNPRADELLIANNYYDDTTAEADLGRPLDESISMPPSGRFYEGYGIDEVNDVHSYGPRFVRFFRDQLWMFGARFPGTENGTELNTDGTSARQVDFKAQSGIAYASQVGNPEYFQFTYDIGRSTGQKDTGMEKFRNTLMFFKESSAYYLDGTSPDNYSIREMDSERGYTVPGSIKSTPAGVIGLGAEGFILFDSIGPGKVISEEIGDETDKINLTYADKISSVYDYAEEKYECHVPIENTYNTRVFVYDMKTRSWSFTKRAGASAAFRVDSNKRIVGLLGDRQNGRLYKTTDRSVVTFNGQTMHGLWRSAPISFSRPNSLKSLQLVEIIARANRDFRLSLEVIPDFEQKDCVQVLDIDPDVREDVWASGPNDSDGMEWDEGQWSRGVVKKKFTVAIQAIGTYFNLIIRNSDSDADRANFEIEEVILHASLLDGDDE